jgi:hypothetical protein
MNWLRAARLCPQRSAVTQPWTEDRPPTRADAEHRREKVAEVERWLASRLAYEPEEADEMQVAA